jgi:hypothetical protein
MDGRIFRPNLPLMSTYVSTSGAHGPLPRTRPAGLSHPFRPPVGPASRSGMGTTVYDRPDPQQLTYQTGRN